MKFHNQKFVRLGRLRSSHRVFMELIRKGESVFILNSLLFKLLFFQKQKERFIQLLQGRRYGQETVYTFNEPPDKLGSNTQNKYSSTLL